jgi:hypothetical protein
LSRESKGAVLNRYLFTIALSTASQLFFCGFLGFTTANLQQMLIVHMVFLDDFGASFPPPVGSIHYGTPDIGVSGHYSEAYESPALTTAPRALKNIGVKTLL